MPFLLVAVVAMAALRVYGVALTTIVAFAVHLGLGITVPGGLIWRALHRGARSRVEDLAAGTAVGYALEVLAYLPARAVGAPLAVIAAPLAVLATFVVVPHLRRYWRAAPDRDRMPTWCAWTVAGAVLLLVGYSCLTFFRVRGLGWPGYAEADGDMAFHLALIGEVKHHVPPVVPWVHGEPLYYHWFVYAELAATSWTTGIEPELLLLRLGPLPMLAAFVALVVFVARRVTGRWWTGTAALVVTFLVLAPDPYRWRLAALPFEFGFGIVDDGSLLRPALWTSPTQTFGAVLFAPAMLLLVDLLRAPARVRSDRVRWALLGVLLAVVAGAKATYLPLLLAGLLAVLVARLLLRRQVHRPALVALLLTLGCGCAAEATLYGGGTVSLTWSPFGSMYGSALATMTGFLDGHPPWWRLVLVVLVFAWCWTCAWAGCAGLLRGRERSDPVAPLLLGLGGAGIAAVSMLSYPGYSQSFFIQSARPYLSIAAVWGVRALLAGYGPPAAPSRRRLVVTLTGTAVAGIATIWLVRAAGRPVVPTLAAAGRARSLGLALALPYLALVAATVAAAVAVAVAVRRDVRAAYRRGAVVVIVLVAGFGLPSAGDRLTGELRAAVTAGWRRTEPGRPAVTEGTLEAGRWLRDHSSPDDLVATNAHCRRAPAGQCENIHFAIAAFTERRVLVEGWGYTSHAHARAAAAGVSVYNVDYWDPALLAANDAAFSRPSVDTVGALRDRYGVRWLFVDGDGPAVAGLGQFAEARFRSGRCTVYDLGTRSTEPLAR